MPALLFFRREAGPWLFLSLLALPFALGPLKTVFTQEGAALNGALHGTARLQLVFGVLFSLGWVLR
ncbi:MAG: hypothetical protein FJ086_19110 [Deltaproteobacteria bacterium]|nr:hypothetical protein [Deltaproteobacteria bacterium]